MTELTIDSVCTKGLVYPVLLNFQNGYPTKNFETNCAVLQDKNRNRTIALETAELVYAGKEEKEGLQKTVVIARDRITGKVRIIEVGTADIKPITKSDLDYLQQQNNAIELNNRLKNTRKRPAQSLLNVPSDTGQMSSENNMTVNQVDLSPCNNKDGCVLPIDREITSDEIDSLNKQQEISRLQFIEFEKKVLKEKAKFRINRETELMETETLNDEQHLTLDENFSEELHVPPINRKARKVKEVYNIDYILTENQYTNIYKELGENYATALHPYIKAFIKLKDLSPKLTVLAAYASELIKYLNMSQMEIRKKNFCICQHSKTLNGILMKKFTKLVICTLPNKVYVRRLRSRELRDKAICHIIVFMFLLNKFKLYLEPLRAAMNITETLTMQWAVRRVGGYTVLGKNGRMVRLSIKMLRKPMGPTVVKPREKDMQYGLKYRIRDKLKTKHDTLTKQTETVTANNMVNHLESKNENIAIDDSCLPPINRDATKIEDLYPLEKILSEDEYQQIYCELDESDYTEVLHPHIVSFMENKTLSVQLTVIAAYASELIKLLHTDQEDIMKSDFKLCHHSKTLNDNIMKGFTKYLTYKNSFKMVRRPDMKLKIGCHIIVFMLILNNFALKLSFLCDVLKTIFKLSPFLKMIEFVGASIIDEDTVMMVQLQPPVPKTTTTINTIGSLPVQNIDINSSQQNNADEGHTIDPDKFYVPFINREATTLEDVYPTNKIFSEEDYYQIYFEFLESNSIEDLHPCIRSLVETKTLSLELTVLAFYASELLKFLPTNSQYHAAIIKEDLKICHHSVRLNEILMNRFLLEYKFNDQTNISGRKQFDMKHRGVCHTIVCMLILNNFQFKLDPLLDAMKNTRCSRHAQKIVSLVGAYIVGTDEGAVVQLKLPLVPKNQVFIKEPQEPSLVDPDEFYLPTINREATKVEDVYIVEKIFSEDEYDIIYEELVRNNYEAKLHPYVKSIMQSKELSSQLIVLAVSVSELIYFLEVCHQRIYHSNFKISHISKKLNATLKKIFIDEKRTVKNMMQDLKDRMVCHIIVCVLILTNFKFKLEPLSNTLIMKNKIINHVQNMANLVGASVIDGDEGPMVELKLPLVPKTQNTSINSRTPKYKNTSRHNNEENGVNPVTVNNTVDHEDISGNEETIDPDYYVPPIDREATKIEEVYRVERFLSKDIYKKIHCDLEESNYNLTEDLHPYIQSLMNMKHLVPKNQVFIKEPQEPTLVDPDEFYLPTINREATKVEDVYIVEKIFSEDEYDIIYEELVRNNYEAKLHPYVKSIMQNKELSSQLIVLAVSVSELIYFLEVCHQRIYQSNFKISHISKKLNATMKKIFIEEKRTVKNMMQDLKDRMVCHIIVCVLILTNFKFKLEPLSNTLIMKNKIINHVQNMANLVGASIIDGDEGPMVELKLPLVPKTQNTSINSRTPKSKNTSRHNSEENGVNPVTVNNTVDHEDISENEETIDPDFYVPPIDREATNIEEVYRVERFLSKDIYKNIHCELEESNYNLTEDLHPYIQSLMNMKNSSSELITVLAVYASELIKFLSVPCNEIKKSNFKICHHSKTLNDILMKEFTELTEYKAHRGGKKSSRIRSRDMKDKIVCHIIVCILILNNFQFKLDLFYTAIKLQNMRCTTEKIQKLVSIVGASIVNADDGPIVKLQLPLGQKTQITNVNWRTPKSKNALWHNIEENKVSPMTANSTVDQEEISENNEETIDPDFYVPPIDREASNIEEVYRVERFLSKDIYKKIHCELEESNYNLSEDLHPYIQSLMNMKSSSSELITVLAVYASELIKFLSVPYDEIKKSNFKICHHSKTLNDILMKEFTELTEYETHRGGKKTSRIRSRDMKDKIVCHIIVCILILNNFQFKLDLFYTAIKLHYLRCTTEKIQKLLSIVGASIANAGDGPIVKLKLPLVQKTQITNINSRTPKSKNALRHNTEENKVSPVTANSTVDQADIFEHNEETFNPDFYVPPIDRQATNIEDVYRVETFLSNDIYEKIHCELEESNYNLTEDLHPYIQSLMNMKTPSSELTTVLTVYASELIKFLSVPYYEIRKYNFKICHYSKILNDILMKEFTELTEYESHTGEKKTSRIRSRDMKDKIVCHIIVCILILNNFQFKLYPFHTAIKLTNMPCTTEKIQKLVSIVGASIANEDDGPVVKLQLPLGQKTQSTNVNSRTPKSKNALRHNIEENKVSPVTANSTADQEDMSENNEETIDPDFYVPPIDREATNIEDVYRVERFLSKDIYEKINCELEESNYSLTADLHPYIQSLMNMKTPSSQLKVLAVYASELMKFLGAKANEIRNRNFKICQHSETLNDILMYKFTEYSKTEINTRIKPQHMKVKAACHIIVCILILNKFKFKLAPFQNAVKKSCGFKTIQKYVCLLGGSINDSVDGKMVQLNLPKTQQNNTCQSEKISRLSGLSAAHQDAAAHSSKTPVSNCLNNLTQDEFNCGKYDPDYYIPPINRNATELENVYLVDKIISKRKCEKIYRELKKSNNIADLHPSIKSLSRTNTSSQFTVLAEYASNLIKLLQSDAYDIKRGSFRICHESDTLNDILIKEFTELVQYKDLKMKSLKRTARIKSEDMKIKIGCHLIVCMLILNNFEFMQDSLFEATKNKNCRSRFIPEMLRLVGVSVVDGVSGRMVQLQLPLVKKPVQAGRKKETASESTEDKIRKGKKRKLR